MPAIMSKNRFSDRELVVGVISGNERETHDFMEIVTEQIKVVLFKYSSVLVPPQDVAQDFYLHFKNKNWQVLSIFEFRSKLRTYLRAVLIRFIHKHYVRTKIFKMQNNQVPLNNLILADESINLIRQIDLKIIKVELLKIINGLKKPNDRLLMTLVLKGTPDKEIALQLNMTTDAIQMRKHRIIKIMKNKF